MIRVIICRVHKKSNKLLVEAFMHVVFDESNILSKNDRTLWAFILKEMIQWKGKEQIKSARRCSWRSSQGVENHQTHQMDQIIGEST